MSGYASIWVYSVFEKGGELNSSICVRVEGCGCSVAAMRESGRYFTAFELHRCESPNVYNLYVSGVAPGDERGSAVGDVNVNFTLQRLTDGLLDCGICSADRGHRLYFDVLATSMLTRALVVLMARPSVCLGVRVGEKRAAGYCWASSAGCVQYRSYFL